MLTNTVTVMVSIPDKVSTFWDILSDQEMLGIAMVKILLASHRLSVRKALTAMRHKLKVHPMIKGCFSESIEDLARAINPIIQGWINYYGRFRKSSLAAIYDHINSKLIKWARRKYKHRNVVNGEQVNGFRNFIYNIPRYLLTGVSGVG